MPRVTVATKGITRKSSIVQTLQRRIPTVVVPRAQKIGERAVALIEIHVDQNFEPRIPSRKNPDTGRGHGLHGSFDYEIEGDTFTSQRSIDIKVLIVSKADPRKIAFMEGGTSPHFIFGEPWLYFPGTANDPGDAYFQATSNGPPTTKTDRVSHPGQAPRPILQRAVRQAVREVSARYR